MAKKVQGFSDFEKATMKERAREVLVDTDGLTALMAKIDEMPEPDKTLATKVHNIIMKAAPSLTPKTWYGMPAYANIDDKVVCFFQTAAKFKARYATLGFNDLAHLDEGNMWPTSFALMKLTSVEEKKIAELVKQAVR